MWRKVGEEDLHDPLEKGAEKRGRSQQFAYYRNRGETGGIRFRGEESEVKRHS